MTGPEHYTAAEQNIDAAIETWRTQRPDATEFHLRMAGVHATLAAAAATALSGADGMTYEDSRAWRSAAGITDEEHLV